MVGTWFCPSSPARTCLFLISKVLREDEIYYRMKDMNRNECLSRCIVFRWCCEFLEGCMSTKDKPRLCQALLYINMNSIAPIDN